jgi:class 3 adenylate cyclase
MTGSLITLPDGSSFSIIKPLVGFSSEIEQQIRRFPFENNVFLMLRFREANRAISDFIIETLNAAGLNGVRADHPDWNLTNNIYNPVAVLYCCKYGLALFDEAEATQAYNSNVIYELGMMHCLGRECLILRNDSLPAVPFDLIKDLYMPYKGDLAVRTNVQRWLQRIAPSKSRPLSSASSSASSMEEFKLEHVAVAAPIAEANTVLASPDEVAAAEFGWRASSKEKKRWTVSWSIKLTNNRQKPTALKVQVLFLDENGFALEDHTGSPTRSISPGETVLHKGTATMSPDLAVRIQRAMAMVSTVKTNMKQHGKRELAPSTGISPIIESKQVIEKTVVELDLVGYSTICANFEEGLDVNTVAQLNQQIQSFVETGLKAANVTREGSVMATTGDGAILVFDLAEDAHRFAQAVHEATRKHNRTRRQRLAKRVFRSGAATGEIAMHPKPGGGFDIAGTTIARAVRLEAKAQPGGFLVDEATYQKLPPKEQGQYGLKTRVAGKRDEEFEAYACQLNKDGPKDVATLMPQKETAHEEVTREFGRDKRRQVLSYFEGLKSNQYVELIFLLEMPIGQRPAQNLNLDQQKAQVLKWTDENAKLDTLLEVLQELTGGQGILQKN